MKVQNFSLSEPFPFSKRLLPLVPKPSVSNSGEVPGRTRPDPVPSSEVHPGGTRWNPTSEQISFLEALYKGGIRTPSAHQIESITAKLGMYGRIEGKNVFYWFQNRKSRERQRQRRTAEAGLCLSVKGSQGYDTGKAVSGKENRILKVEMASCWGGDDGSAASVLTVKKEEERFEDSSYYKWKWRSWGNQVFDTQISKSFDGQKQEEITLELFPLHPEPR